MGVAPTARARRAAPDRRWAALLLVGLVLVGLVLAATARADPHGAARIPVAYEGAYARALLAPEGPFETLLPLGGVVDVRRDGAELRVTRPGGGPVRFVAAGVHRFLAPTTGELLTFDVADGRVRSGFLDGDRTAVLTPVGGWRASLLRLGNRLAGSWEELGAFGRRLAPF